MDIVKVMTFDFCYCWFRAEFLHFKCIRNSNFLSTVEQEKQVTKNWKKCFNASEISYSELWINHSFGSTCKSHEWFRGMKKKMFKRKNKPQNGNNSIELIQIAIWVIIVLNCKRPQNIAYCITFQSGWKMLWILTGSGRWRPRTEFKLKFVRKNRFF